MRRFYLLCTCFQKRLIFTRDYTNGSTYFAAICIRFHDFQPPTLGIFTDDSRLLADGALWLTDGISDIRGSPISRIFIIVIFHAVIF